jgi:hypothetical protein
MKLNISFLSTANFPQESLFLADHETEEIKNCAATTVLESIQGVMRLRKCPLFVPEMSILWSLGAS